MLVAVIFSFEGYDSWCALNKSRTAEVKIPRKDVRAVLSKWKGRNSLLAHATDDDIDLHGNEIYFSRAPIRIFQMESLALLGSVVRAGRAIGFGGGSA